VGDRPATIGIGAKVVGHTRRVAFQVAEVAISNNLFAGLDGGPTAVPVASSASGHYGTGKAFEKIANTDHIGRRRRRHPANVGLDICAKHE
jgi:hypothetical protein